jgi:hypothetical protein
MEVDNVVEEEAKPVVDAFKAPMAPPVKPTTPTTEKVEEDSVETSKPKQTTKSPAELAYGTNNKSLAYKEPPWAGLPPDNDPVYNLEEIKNGTIVATHKLVGKSYFIIGRLPACDIQVKQFLEMTAKQLITS